jgi:hypothetical protein
VLSKRQRRAPFVDKTYECAISKNLTGERLQFRNDANTTDMLGFVSKLLQGPLKTRGSRGIFFGALNIF